MRFDDNGSVGLFLQPAEVQIWCRITDGLADADPAALEVLSDQERAQHRRFVFARDRRDYAEAHALLRRSLSRCADVHPAAWRFDTLPGGKPVLLAPSSSGASPATPVSPLPSSSIDHPPEHELGPALFQPHLSFNLSHTHGLVACAITDGADVGIDVEATDRVVDPDVAKRFFSASENEDLWRCEADEQFQRFFELWTLKEAYVKAIGKGLAHPLNTIVFEFATDSIHFRPPPDVARENWQFALFKPTDRHCMAVAVRRAARREALIEARTADGAIVREYKTCHG